MIKTRYTLSKVFGDWLSKYKGASVKTSTLAVLESVEKYRSKSVTLLELSDEELLNEKLALRFDKNFIKRYPKEFHQYAEVIDLIRVFGSSTEYITAFGERKSSGKGTTPSMEKTGQNIVNIGSVPGKATAKGWVVVDKMSPSQILNIILSKCVIEFEGCEVSKESLIQAFNNFLIQTYDKEKHNVGIVAHTGSIIFDVAAVIFAAISNLIANKTTPTDLVNSLNPGDLVTYNGGKFRFVNIFTDHGNKYARFEQDDKTHYAVSVPQHLWWKIVPYNGDATTLDGHGVKNNIVELKCDFYKSVLGYDEKDIPTIIDTSTVIVMHRDTVDRILNGTDIAFGDKKIDILDLVSASYYTDENVYHYRGNIGKNEPVLKFAGRVSAARSQILKRDGNKNIGLMIFGDSVLSSSQSELPELLDRRSLMYVYVFAGLSSNELPMIAEERENAVVFACTKDMLLSQKLDQVCRNTHTDRLYSQVNTIVDCCISPIRISGVISWEKYREFRDCISIVRKSDYSSDLKDDFIQISWSLMNIIKTALFPLRMIDELIAGGTITASSIQGRLDRLGQICDEFFGDLQTACRKIIDILSYGCRESENESEKGEALHRLLMEHCTQSVCLVVPKEWYGTIIRNSDMPKLIRPEGSLKIVNTSNFTDSDLYDVVIVAGDISGKHFDTFTCKSAPDIIPILCECEAKTYRTKERKANDTLNMYNRRTSKHMHVDYVETSQEDDLEELTFIEEETKKIELYIQQYEEQSIIRQANYTGKTESDIEVAVVFENGEKAYLTPFYKAYVYDDATGEVTQKEVTKLTEGLSIVFTRTNDDTRDIVDEIIDALKKSGHFKQKQLSQIYKAARWKNVLKEYMDKSEEKASTIAEKLKSLGAPVEEPSILRWLDPFAHIIGPRSIESLKSIGILTQNADLRDNPDEVFNACKEVRSIRRDILTYIGKVIMDGLGNKRKDNASKIYNIVSDKVDNIATILRISRVVSMHGKKMPVNCVNRPLDVE